MTPEAERAALGGIKDSAVFVVEGNERKRSSKVKVFLTAAATHAGHSGKRNAPSGKIGQPRNWNKINWSTFFE